MFTYLFKIPAVDTAALDICTWCGHSFAMDYTDAWWSIVDDGPIHGRCVAERSHRMAMTDLIRTVMDTMDKFAAAETRVRVCEAADPDRHAPEPVYCERDDMAVNVARSVAPLMAGLSVDGRYYHAF